MRGPRKKNRELRGTEMGPKTTLPAHKQRGKKKREKKEKCLSKTQRLRFNNPTLTAAKSEGGGWGGRGDGLGDFFSTEKRARKNWTCKTGESISI